MGFKENLEKLSEDVKRRRVEKPVGVIPKRFIKILVERGGVKCEAGVWVYMSTGRDYLIVPKVFCSCENFLIEVIGGRRSYCKHLYYQQISELLLNYKEVSIKEEFFYRIIKEILDLNMSTTLRKVLYGGVKNGG